MSGNHKRHFPRYNDPVNVRSRAPKAINGFVQRVLYDDGPQTVIVKFADGIEEYDFDEVRSSWTTMFGGCFILSQ